MRTPEQKAVLRRLRQKLSQQEIAHPSSFGDAIRELRRGGINDASLCLELERPRNTIHGWARNANLPRDEELERLNGRIIKFIESELNHKEVAAQ